jgi:hypothetical protein
MRSITLNYSENNAIAKRTVDYILSLGVFEIMSKPDRLTYEGIGNLKAEQDHLIAEGKMQKPEMIVGFTPEERKMFDNGIPITTVFEHLTELHVAKC